MAGKMPTSQAEPNDEKLRELILYLAVNSEGDHKFGKTKLNKLLFFCDFRSYYQLGHSITGHAYFKQDHGPCPKAFVPVTKKMVDSGDCSWRADRRYDDDQQKLVALREPRANIFTGEEIDLIRNVIDQLWNSDGKEASLLSHDFLAWQLAETGETIPYEAILVPPASALSDEDAEWARSEVEAYLEDCPVSA
jgi:Antitoxin SocA-like, Panacea domain